MTQKVKRGRAALPNLSHAAMTVTTLPNLRIKRSIMYCFLLGTWTDAVLKCELSLIYLGHASEIFPSHFQISLSGGRRVALQYFAVNIRFLLNKCKEGTRNFSSGY